MLFAHGERLIATAGLQPSLTGHQSKGANQDGGSATYAASTANQESKIGKTKKNKNKKVRPPASNCTVSTPVSDFLLRGFFFLSLKVSFTELTRKTSQQIFIFFNI